MLQTIFFLYLRMNWKFTFAFLALLCLFACDDDTKGIPERPEEEPINLLMIGNSHTYYNDMPEIVRQIALSHGDEVQMETLTLAGASFKNHVEGSGNQALIQSQDWDYVVLQENASVAARASDIAAANMYPFAETLVDWVKTNHQPTRVYYYLTQAYSVGAPWCDEVPTVCDYDGMLDAIRANYIALDGSTPAQVCPAGIAWKILFNEIPGIELHDDDTVHPNLLGSYVSACTIYASLFQRPLDDTSYRPESIDEATAQSIYSIINALVIDGAPDWRYY